MKALHLFAGAGGSILTGHLLGWSSVGAVEIDPFCCAVLDKNGEKVLGHDIKTFSADLAGRVDVVCGGFPCQDVSNAGKRAGAGEETRSGLWRHMLRVWRETGAPYLFAENVRGLLSSGEGSDYAEILGEVANLGADAVWCVCAASSVGAPHKRERWFMLAHAPGARRSGWESGQSGEIRDQARRAELGGRGAGDVAHAGHRSVQRRGEPGELPGAAGAGESEMQQRERDGHAVGHGGEVGEVAHAPLHGRGEGIAGSGERARGRGHAASGGDVGNALSTGLEGRDSGGPAPWSVVGPDIGPSESSFRGAVDGLAPWMDGWPAGRGSAQHLWEAPRVITHKEPNRINRLKALGNGWVPSQAAEAFVNLWRRLHD